MSALDDIQTLLDSMRSRQGEIASFEKLLGEISVQMGDIVALMEKDDDSAIAEAIRAIQIPAPEVTVNIPQAKAPEVVVNVPAPQVTVNVPEEKQPKGWKLLITGRDGNGAIREIVFKPEM